MHRLTELTLDHPRIAAAILLVVTVVLGAGAPRVPVEHGWRVLVGENHPTVKTFDEVVTNFAGGLPIEIGWACGDARPCKHALDLASLDLASSITGDLSSLTLVQKVYSPSNTAILVPAAEGLRVRRFVENGRAVDDRKSLVSHVTSDTLWVNRLISDDLGMAAIIVQPVDNTTATGASILDQIHEILAPLETRGFQFHLNGTAVRTVISGRELQLSTARILPALVLVIALILYVLAGSVAQVAISLGTMGIGLLWTQGAMGWLGWPQDGVHQVLAPLVLVVGVCDAIHLLSRTSEVPGSVRSRLIESARSVAAPCFITTATTAAALASFATSNLASFSRLGLIAAFGVSACFLLTFTLLPLFALATSRFFESAATRNESWNRSLQRLVHFSRFRSKSIIAWSGVLLVAGTAGWIGRLDVDTDWLRAFGKNSSISRSIDFFNDARGSSDSLEVQIELPDPDLFADPKALSIVENYSRALISLNGLETAISLLDLIHRLKIVIAPEVAEDKRFLPSLSGNAELLELLSFEDPDTISPWLTLDRTKMRISFAGGLHSQDETKELMDAVRAATAKLIPDDWTVTFTGLIAIDDFWMPEVQATQMRSFPVAFGLVLLLASAFLRSYRLGLMAMIPTLVPIVTMFGAMGWIGIGLDIGRAMVAAVVIGIGVDDAIHFLSAYSECRTEGVSRIEAATAAIHRVGRALVTTSVALTFGFLTLMASAWQTISTFGFFVSLTVVSALASTLLLLPALLLGPWNRGDADD